MDAINSVYSFCSTASRMKLIPGILEAFNKGPLAAQDFVRRTIKVIINFNAESMRSQLADPSAFYQSVDMIVAKLQNAANLLPNHMKGDFWQYVKVILKEEMTAFLEAERVSEQFINNVCKHIDTLVDAQHTVFTLPI